MLNNEKPEILLHKEKNLFQNHYIAPAKKFYLWLTLFAIVTGVCLLVANGHISFGNIFACGVCFIVAITWFFDGLKTKHE